MGLQSVDKSKPEQGQGEEFIAMLNPVTLTELATLFFSIECP